MKVLITSQNPTKINVTKEVFREIFPDQEITFEAFVVSSDVSDQPKSDKETMQGAINRVQNAINKYNDYDFYVGIEGGIEFLGDRLFSMDWVYISNKIKSGIAKSASYPLPIKVKELLDDGMELGQASDIVFNTKDSKKINGIIGNITDDKVKRDQKYKIPLILALMQIVKEFYP